MHRIRLFLLQQSGYRAKGDLSGQKERWDIEECFDYLKNSVRAGASHTHNDKYFRVWAFLNHISLLFYYGLINAINVHHLSEKLNPKEAILVTKDICKVTDADGGKRLTHINSHQEGDSGYPGCGSIDCVNLYESI